MSGLFADPNPPRTPNYAPKPPPAKSEAPAPVKDQAKALHALNVAYQLASDHASEPKMQELFRERFRDYRDEYLTPKPAK